MRWFLPILLSACAGAQSPTLQRSTSDVDGDGVIDVDDRCPYEYGIPPTGCPDPAPPEPRESTIEVEATPEPPDLGTPPPAGTPPLPASPPPGS